MLYAQILTNYFPVKNVDALWHQSQIEQVIMASVYADFLPK